MHWSIDCANLGIVSESQIRTADRFGIDYVSVISDPTREAFDCGAQVDFFDDQPPAIDEARALLREKSGLEKLRAPQPERSTRMRDRLEGLREFRRRVGDRKLIEGWIEGPCAEAADLRGINNVMLDFYDYPITHSLLGALGWSVLFGAAYFALRRRPRAALIFRRNPCVASGWLFI